VARVEEEKVASARADLPEAAFEMPLEQAGIKEHIFNILTEAGIETVGDLMMKMKLDENSVLGLSGIGPKAMENIEESLAAITFPEPTPAEATVDSVPETEAQPEAVMDAVPETAEVTEIAEEAVNPIAVEAIPLEEKQTKAKKESKKKVEEEEEDEGHKDGVSLDELFTMKPEIFQAINTDDDEESKDKKKGKKGKKKSVALEFDEELGEVVARKKHKRGSGDDFGEEEW
jgi:hypothetical protein